MYKVGTVKGQEYYGVIDHGAKTIDVNSDIVVARQYAALMHEGLHAIERFYRWEVPHKTITAIATTLITMLPYKRKLESGRWIMNMNRFPILMQRNDQGLTGVECLREMIKTVSYFNKWPIDDLLFKIMANMVWTFNLQAKSLNEETGQWE